MNRSIAILCHSQPYAREGVPYHEGEMPSNQISLVNSFKEKLSAADF